MATVEEWVNSNGPVLCDDTGTPLGQYIMLEGDYINKKRENDLERKVGWLPIDSPSHIENVSLYIAFKYRLLLCGLFYEAICFALPYFVRGFQSFSQCDYLAWGKANLKCFSYLCSIFALVLSISSSSWCLGRAAVCDCGTP